MDLFSSYYPPPTPQSAQIYLQLLSNPLSQLYLHLHIKYPIACQILIELECYRQIFEKGLNTKCHGNPVSGCRVVPRGRTDRQTDLTKLIVVFRNFANAPQNYLASN